MSIVGRRPLLKTELDSFTAEVAKTKGGGEIVREYNHTVIPAKPGILSTLGTHSHSGESISPRERFLMDIEDHHNASVHYDSRLVTQFVSAAIKGRLVSGRVGLTT